MDQGGRGAENTGKCARRVREAPLTLQHPLDADVASLSHEGRGDKLSELRGSAASRENSGVDVGFGGFVVIVTLW